MEVTMVENLPHPTVTMVENLQHELFQRLTSMKIITIVIIKSVHTPQYTVQVLLFMVIRFSVSTSMENSFSLGTKFRGLAHAQKPQKIIPHEH